MSSAPENLQKLLFDAASEGDLDRLTALCEAHEQAILEAFSGWRTVPEEHRRGPTLRWYVQGMGAVAQHMAAARGKPELALALSTMPAETRRALDLLEAGLVEVDACMAEGRFGDAISKANAALDAAAGNTTALTAILLGRLGNCHLHRGDLVAARRAFERVLVESEASGDVDGKLAARDALCEIFRYLGEGSAAAEELLRMADLLEGEGRGEEAKRLLRRAALVGAGEPLCRVALHVEGETLELDEAATIDGRFELVYVRNRSTLRPALVAIEEGERAGSIGDFPRSLEAFRRASALDPFDPSPVYQAGVALLFMDRAVEAAEFFRRVEELAPGWYRCRTYRFLAERIAAGVLSSEVFLMVTALERPRLPSEEKARLAEQGISLTNHALFYGALGDAQRELGRLFEARATYRRGLGLAQQPDVRTQLLVKLGGVVEDLGERVALFEEASALEGDLTAAAVARISLAAMRRG